MHAIYLFLIVAVFFMVYCEGVRLLNSVFSCTEIYMHPDVGDLSLLVRSFRSNLFFQNSNKSFPYLIKKKKTLRVFFVTWKLKGEERKSYWSFRTHPLHNIITLFLIYQIILEVYIIRLVFIRWFFPFFFRFIFAFLFSPSFLSSEHTLKQKPPHFIFYHYKYWKILMTSYAVNF